MTHQNEHDPVLGLAAVSLDTLTGSPAGTIGKVALESVRHLVGRHSDARSARAVADLAAEWARIEDIDPDEAEQQVLDMLRTGSAEIDDAMYASFRAMANSRVPAAWPHIARLTSQYLSRGRPVDTFFRNTADLLESLETDDIDALKVLSRLSRSEPDAKGRRRAELGGVFVDIASEMRRTGELRGGDLVDSPGQAILFVSVRATTSDRFVRLEDWRWLLSALCARRLATARHSGDGPGVRGTHLRVSSTSLSRVLALF